MPPDLLVLIWVHGFKGNEVTFESFPDRICHLLTSTHPSLKIESHVFPAYQTRGELHAATLAFVDWLTTLVVTLENGQGEGGGAGKAKVILMGHSMGGLLIADAARDVASNTRPGDPLWPNIVAVIAFDTPYLGLHPHTFKHGLTTAAGYFEQAKSIASAVPWGKATSSTTTAPTTSTGGWGIQSKALYGLGALALGAAVGGTAYYRREDFLSGWKWGYEHMTFVKNLWDEQGMRTRLEDIERLRNDHAVLFQNHYTHLPATPGKQLVARTFCILPAMTHPLYTRFIPASNTLAKDEIGAHMGMFNAKTNDGFYDLGLAIVGAVAERMDGAKAVQAGIGWREEKQGDKVVWVEEDE